MIVCYSWNEPRDHHHNSEKKELKARKYNEAYLSSGFTSTSAGQEERSQCAVGLKILVADKMKPTKVKRHLETHQHYQIKQSIDRKSLEITALERAYGEKERQFILLGTHTHRHTQSHPDPDRRFRAL